MPPCAYYVKQFNAVAAKLFSLTPTVSSVMDLPGEEAELQPVKIFRKLMRHKNIIESFPANEAEDFTLPLKRFTDYQSAYLALYNKVKTDDEKESQSVLSDVNFEFELMHRNVINMHYIFTFLAQLCEADASEQVEIHKLILDSVADEIKRRNEGQLIQKFMETALPN